MKGVRWLYFGENLLLEIFMSCYSCMGRQLMYLSIVSTLVRGRIKGIKENITGCYKKYHLGVRQLAFIKAFYILAIHFNCHYYTSKDIVMCRLSGTAW